MIQHYRYVSLLFREDQILKRKRRRTLLLQHGEI